MVILDRILTHARHLRDLFADQSRWGRILPHRSCRRQSPVKSRLSCGPRLRLPVPAKRLRGKLAETRRDAPCLGAILMSSQKVDRKEQSAFLTRRARRVAAVTVAKSQVLSIYVVVCRIVA